MSSCFRRVALSVSAESWRCRHPLDWGGTGCRVVLGVSPFLCPLSHDDLVTLLTGVALDVELFSACRIFCVALSNHSEGVGEREEGSGCQIVAKVSHFGGVETIACRRALRARECNKDDYYTTT